MKRIKHIIVLLIIAGLFAATPTYADEILYARYPAISPDGKTIAFTYQGDIWLVSAAGGEAKRLTIHQAEDIRPHFSPDGNTLLFSSRRFDNYDLFTIPVTGGEPTQLTFHSSTDYGSGWFPQGDSVLFFSSRDGRGDMFKISVSGGMPIKLTGHNFQREFDGKLSSDATKMIFTTGTGLVRWWRSDLRTGGNSDIFIQDRSKPEFTSFRLTDHPDYEMWPILNESKEVVYYVACYGDIAQIYFKPVTGGEAVQVTNFTDDGVQFLNSDPDGTLLVFEQGFKVWVMNPGNQQPRQVSITVASDERANLVERKTFEDEIQWFSLSPDDKKIAVTIHGEIFVFPADDPTRAKRVTFTSARERYPMWGSDSRRIYYCSDRDGNWEIYSVDVASGDEERLTTTDEDELKPLPSPDGKYLVYYRGLEEIIRRDLDSNMETIWVRGAFFDLGVEPTREYDWSPDSRWLTFTMAGPTYETDMFVVSLDSEPVNISNFAEWNYRPRFSDDGKMVYFTSTISDRYDTYKIDLVHKPVEFDEASLDSLFLPESRKENEAESDKAISEPVQVDLTRIEKRRARAFKLQGESHYPVLTPDGEKFLFVASLLGKPEIWMVSRDDEPDLKQLTHSGKNKSQLQVSADSKHLYFLEESKLKKLEIEKEKIETLDFKATMEIDLFASNRQKFCEGWWMLNSYFYDPTFHGADWDAVKTKYEPLLPHVRTEVEFGNLIKEMMGELRASHLHIYSKAPGPDENVVSGCLGIEFNNRSIEQDGYYQINYVLPESPADFADLRVGQYVTAIDGQHLSRGTNLYKMLSGKVGRRVNITVSNNPSGDDRTVEIKPVPRSEISNLRYEAWVESRRQMVDSLSLGRLAYLHIRSMNQAALDRFKQQLVSIAEEKEGLIIDVRENSGGWIAVHLLGMLQRTPFILRNFRGFPTTSENKMRAKASEKPMVLLINNFSGSNSEIFTEGFRKLKLGKIIGEPTGGGVIGTASYTLIDGTRIRRPSWGAFTTEMEDTDLKPRQPDIFIENLPDDLIAGRDPQLVRAVTELLKELKY